MTRKLKEIIIKRIFFLFACVSILILGLIVTFLFREGIPIFHIVSVRDFLFGSDLLLVDGLMMDASISAVKRAREMNIPTMLDAGSARPGMTGLAGLCDYVVASEVFAEGLGWGLKPEALLKEFKALRCNALTVTQGENGSITVSDDCIIRMPAFTVEAVDTTGAGDVFHAGYIYGLLQGWDLETVLRFAAALAALICMRVGGRAGAPRLGEVAEFLRAHNE